jgi:uncharacterized membrane protein (DUF441 family)
MANQGAKIGMKVLTVALGIPIGTGTRTAAVQV